MLLLLWIMLSISPREISAAPVANATPGPASPASASGKTPVDASLKPGTDEEVSNVFKDMGVVQRRAMPKAGRFLLSTFATLDFSDGPYTNYSFNVNPGYALSDFFEVYLDISPFYIVSPRSIVSYISRYQDANNAQATISAALPKYRIGAEFLWSPLYGKDSLGLSRIIRSDTFLKLGISRVTYDTGTGLRFVLGAGKTYFIGRSLGFRFSLDYGYIQSTVNSVQSFSATFLTEFGVVLYM